MTEKVRRASVSPTRDSPLALADSARRQELALVLAVVCVAGVAIFLRTQQLTIQWLTDDEWHAVHKLVRSADYLSILSSFGQYDYSIPLTAFYKLLADTVGLTELGMRFPMLLSGLVFVALGVAWARRRFGNAVALVFGFLLAVSPLLVNHSRNARPYMITLLLSAVALWALARWVKTRDNRFLLVHLPCAWLASYLHPIVLPFVTAPWIIVLASAAKSPTMLGRALIGAGVATIGLCILVLPPLVSDWSAMASKSSAHVPDLQTFIGIWHTWLGTESVPVVVLAASLSVMGLPAVKRVAGMEAAMWVIGLLAILAAIFWMKPAWIHNPQTLARYMLPAQPLWLLLVSAGTASVLARIPNRPARAAAGAALASSFLWGTSYPALLARPNNFTLHSYYQFDYRRDRNPVRQLFAESDLRSPLWARLRNNPPGSRLVAYGGNLSFESFYLPAPAIQAQHGQRMIALQLGGACRPVRDGEAFPRQGVMLKNAVSLALPGDIEEKGVDWIVLHHYVPRFALEGTSEYDAWFKECKTYLQQRLGAPEYADERFTAFYIRPAVRHNSRSRVSLEPASGLLARAGNHRQPPFAYGK